MTELPGGPEFAGNPEESNFVKAAGVEVNKLIEANRVNEQVITTIRRVVRGLVVVTALVVIVIGTLSYVTYRQHQDDNELRQGEITSCEAGNTFRSEQTQIWTDFIGLLINASTPAAELKIAHNFIKNDVGKQDALRNCSALDPASTP